VVGLVDPAAPDDPAAAMRVPLRGLPSAWLPPAPEQADAITPRVAVGLDVAQVAASIGKCPGIVRVLTHRGLRRLAEGLGAHVAVRGRSEAQ
jgi:DNA-directed RNA polymerase specialized sigma24 family protein